MNLSAPARASPICLYKSISAHFFRRAGSVCGRFAFCANLVCGRLIVFFNSSGGASIGLVVIVQRRNSNRMSVCFRSPRVSEGCLSLEFHKMYLALPHGRASETKNPNQLSLRRMVRAVCGLCCFARSADKHLLVPIAAVNWAG